MDKAKAKRTKQMATIRSQINEIQCPMTCECLLSNSVVLHSLGMNLLFKDMPEFIIRVETDEDIKAAKEVLSGITLALQTVGTIRLGIEMILSDRMIKFAKLEDKEMRVILDEFYGGNKVDMVEVIILPTPTIH